jgi:hypothetical protein
MLHIKPPQRKPMFMVGRINNSPSKNSKVGVIHTNTGIVQDEIPIQRGISILSLKTNRPTNHN